MMSILIALAIAAALVAFTWAAHDLDDRDDNDDDLGGPKRVRVRVQLERREPR